ncbi:glutathione S-transferase family protein [Rhodobacteraceae bacterium SC52]|nr:glutathione S-transferase family protein [Rhodobacteraceae bacterium SC52]
MTEDLTLYAMPSSGNSYKVQLLLGLLGRSYAQISCEYESEALAQAHAAGALPLGKVPALHLADGTILSESGAILWYLANGTPWVPADLVQQSEMLGWMFFEQNRMEGVIAVRAALRTYPHRAASATPERLAALLDDGHDVLSVVDAHLTGRDWLVGDTPTIADIALYGYTHSSGSRGGYDMARFPAINGWCERMAALPGYVKLQVPE